MFNFLKPKKTGETLILKLSGLHCTSCSLNIDGELEALPGVISSHTSYAKQTTVITYEPLTAHPNDFTRVIEQLGYTVLT